MTTEYFERSDLLSFSSFDMNEELLAAAERHQYRPNYMAQLNYRSLLETA